MRAQGRRFSVADPARRAEECRISATNPRGSRRKPRRDPPSNGRRGVGVHPCAGWQVLRRAALTRRCGPTSSRRGSRRIDAATTDKARTVAFHFTQAAVQRGAEKAITTPPRRRRRHVARAHRKRTATTRRPSRWPRTSASNDVRIDLLFAQAAAEWQASGDDKPPQTSLERAFVLLDPEDHDRLARLAILYSGRSHRWIRLANLAPSLIGRGATPTPNSRGRELLELALAEVAGLTALSGPHARRAARTLYLRTTEDPDRSGRSGRGTVRGYGARSVIPSRGGGQGAVSLSTRRGVQEMTKKSKRSRSQRVETTRPTRGWGCSLALAV